MRVGLGQRAGMDSRPDLSRLTTAEREVLALLAEGHTIKSVAATTGRSEGSVNERLREARRKTGVGSSRELARLIRDQENRDEEIGMAVPEPAAATAAGASRRVRVIGVLAMTIVLAAVTAALTLTGPAKQAGPNQRSPRTLFQDAEGVHVGDAESWHYETLAQRRDPTWADVHEAVLRRLYAAIPDVDMATLRIDCRESKCEVVGSRTGVAVPADVQRACERLVSPAMRDSLIADGLRGRFLNCGGFDVTRRISFLGYWVGPDD